jgi:transcriptional regulator with XRE-family HTH domain
MGRPENPIDTTVPERAALAAMLRRLRQRSRLTYQDLATHAELSAATLKRAASGTTVPREATVESFVRSCRGSETEVATAIALWKKARIAERGQLHGLNAPAPSCISSQRDLSLALRAAYERAGASTLRRMQEKARRFQKSWAPSKWNSYVSP